MPTGNSQFSAPYDSTTKIMSVVICVLLAVVAALTRNAFVVLIGTALLFFTFAFSPREYSIQDRSIVVKRLIGNVIISLDGIREARIATADDLRGAIRLWANGGLFGHYGLFRTSKLGKCWWYVTNRKNAVVVVTEQKTVLFSPDDVDGFLAAIRAAVPVAAIPPTLPFLDSQRSQSSGSRMNLVGVGIAVAVLAVVAFAFMYSPGPPSYTLTPTSLTIHDRFYPVTVNAADMDVEHIRVVDVSQNSDWRPVDRTNGFANAHYHSGWFRVANGQRVRMYGASGKRLVLLPPKGRATLFSWKSTGPRSSFRSFVRNGRIGRECDYPLPTGAFTGTATSPVSHSSLKMAYKKQSCQTPWIFRALSWRHSLRIPTFSSTRADAGFSGRQVAKMRWRFISEKPVFSSCRAAPVAVPRPQ